MQTLAIYYGKRYRLHQRDARKSQNQILVEEMRINAIACPQPLAIFSYEKMYLNRTRIKTIVSTAKLGTVILLFRFSPSVETKHA